MAKSKAAAASSSPSMDVYVGLMVVSFVALSCAIGLLISEIVKYKGF